VKEGEGAVATEEEVAEEAAATMLAKLKYEMRCIVIDKTILILIPG